ncbi:MAG: hypothetical protein CL730_05020 [Chloroflexi bacterium]|nr:hypothetical protein [Chloroflexota bacterium]
MSKYSGMKRTGSSRAISERFAETQKKFIRGVLFLIAITLLIVFVFGDHGLFQLYKLKRERAEIQKYISELRENREMLITEKNRLENDLEYIEKLAREKYRMALPGEKVFKGVPKESNKRPNE